MKESSKETQLVEPEIEEETLPTLAEALALEQLKSFMLQNLELVSKLKLRLKDETLDKLEEIEQLTVYDFARHEELDDDDEQSAE